MKNQKARSFVVIMMVIALAALSLRFVIIQLLRVTIEQNQANAQETLKLVATALENYAASHGHMFPSSLKPLVETNPPYIKKDYVNLAVTKGYSFFCNRLEASGYMCQAVPLRCAMTGRQSYTVTTGVSLSTEECVKIADNR